MICYRTGGCGPYEKRSCNGCPASNPTYVAQATRLAIERAKAPISLDDYRRDAMRMVNAERDRQDSKWGEQNHVLPLWLGILGEEYGELCQAVNETVFDNGPEERQKGGYENVMTEACQVAAVAVSIMECLERNRDKWGM